MRIGYGIDAAGHQDSTVRRGARILVNVHPGPRLGLLTDCNHQFLRLWQAAEDAAVRVFAGNLRELLLAARGRASDNGA
jgi:hypothetical protein